MHFITGGAFNGKSAWVRQFYDKGDQLGDWRSAYQTEIDLECNDLASIEANFFVIEGVEMLTKQLASRYSLEEARNKWQAIIQKWLAWEQADGDRTVVIIGTDITKGIVPLDPAERKWRDVTGWAFQDITKVADRVDLVWYGMIKRLK